MSSNTPNLGLLKKDPVTDGNDTFNIETMLNDNWDKIDEAFENIDVDMPDASLTQKGIVQLSNATNGTREDIAPTEKALGLVMAEATAGKQAGNERKAEVVAALVAKGISATTSETWAQLIVKLTAIVKATGNAVLSDVLAGKTFSNAMGNNLTGTMVKQPGYVTPTGYFPDGTGILYSWIPKGAYLDDSGSGTGLPGIRNYDEDFIAANFPATKNIFGLQGTMRDLSNSTVIGTAFSGDWVQRAGQDIVDIKFVSVPTAGKVDPTTKYEVGIVNLVPKHIVEGVTISIGANGMVGTAKPKLAKGVVIGLPDFVPVTIFSGEWGGTSSAVARVTGLTFKPSVVIINTPNDTMLAMYATQLNYRGYPEAQFASYNLTDSANRMGFRADANLYVTETSFSLPIPASMRGQSLSWYAYQ